MHFYLIPLFLRQGTLMTYSADNLSAFPFLDQQYLGIIFPDNTTPLWFAVQKLFARAEGQVTCNLPAQFSKLPGAVQTLSIAGQAGPRMQCYHRSPSSGRRLATLQRQWTWRASAHRKGPKENTAQPQSKERRPKFWDACRSPASTALWQVVTMAVNFFRKGQRKVDN